MLSRTIQVTRLAKIAWYTYFVLLAIFLVASAASILSERPTVFDVLDAPMAITALVGVLGFASRTRVLSPGFWRVFMPALVAWDITYNLVLAEQLDLALRSVESSAWDLAVGVGFLTPMYVALFLYGYRSQVIWAGQPRLGLTRLPGFDTNAQRWFGVATIVAIVPLVVVLTALGPENPLLYGSITALVMAATIVLVVALAARLRPQDFTFTFQVCDFAYVGAFRLPRTRHEALWGGWTCRGCGNELDRHGNLRT